MKRIILSVIILVYTSLAAQSDSISLLRKRVDSLQTRLDEKNYTRVPNKDLEDAFKTKVKEEVNGWFSSNLLVGGGIVAAIVALIMTVGRRMITKELNEKLKTYVIENTTDISKRFDDHRKVIKEDFVELKESINGKLGETQQDIKKYREESIEIIKKYKAETEESFNEYVDNKIMLTDIKVAEFQNELNETVNPLFNQSVESILQRANKTDKNEKDEELIKYLEKLFKKGKLPSEKSAAEALDALVTYYYYRLNTKKMEALINDYGNSYNLSATCYANAALAFLDKYEAKNQLDFRNSCISYCNEAIKKSNDYGIAYVVQILANIIDYRRGFDDIQKEVALLEIKKIFHHISFIKSAFIAKDVIKEINSYEESYLKEYVALLYTQFPKELQELQEQADKAEEPVKPV